MADIRMLEDEVKRELDQKLCNMGMNTASGTKEGSVRSTPF